MKSATGATNQHNALEAHECPVSLLSGFRPVDSSSVVAPCPLPARAGQIVWKVTVLINRQPQPSPTPMRFVRNHFAAELNIIEG